ncbi:MAG: hypothetical protein V1913_17630 [Fibrobacterota bacterium]
MKTTLLTCCVLLALFCGCLTAPPSAGAATGKVRAAMIKDAAALPCLSRLPPAGEITVRDSAFPMYAADKEIFQYSGMSIPEALRMMADCLALDTAGLGTLPNPPEEMKGGDRPGLFQLEECQAASVVALIASGIPVMFEHVGQDGSVYGIFYRHRLAKNTVTVGEMSNRIDPELVYLVSNVDNLRNVFKVYSKQRVDMNQADYSPDLFDSEKKERYDNLQKSRYAHSEKNPNQYYSYIETQSTPYQHLFINRLFVLTPSKVTETALAKIISCALGDRDFSYTPPKIKRLK